MNSPTHQKWLIAGVALLLAYCASVVLIPAFLALFLAMLLDPFAGFLVRHKVSRPLASGLVIGTFLIVATGTGWLSYLYLYGLVNDLPEYAQKFHGLAEELNHSLHKLEFSTRAFTAFLQTPKGVQQVQVVERFPSWTQYLVRGVGTLYGLMTLGIFVPMLLFYLLIDKSNLVESLNVLLGRHFYLPTLNSELPKMIRAFFSANLITGVFMVAVQAGVLYLLGFTNWLSLGVLTGFANLVPLIGAPIAVFLCTVQGIIQFDTASPVVLAGITLLGTHFIANNMILPQLVRSRVNVNPAALIFGMLFWTWVWGAAGFLLAIPMTALIKILLDSSPDTRALANLLAAKPRQVLKTHRVRNRPWLSVRGANEVPLQGPASGGLDIVK